MADTDLAQALLEIRSIRHQVAQSTEFRGYGPRSLFVAAGLAGVTGVVQARWLPRPASHPGLYVALWLSLAVVCAALIATEMLTRARRHHHGMADAMVTQAVQQFLPAGVAGAVVPLVLLHAVAEPGRMLWLLPGLWQIVFSLGVFASCRGLPRAMLLVGAWFFLTGVALVSLGDNRALAPWWMAGAYAVGIAAVAVLHARSTPAWLRGKEADDTEG